MKSKLLTAAAITLALFAGQAIASCGSHAHADTTYDAAPTAELTTAFDAAPAGASPAAAFELDPGPVPPPTEDAGGFVETLYDWWSQGRFKPAIILALWGLAWLLTARIPWLGIGRRAIVMAALTEALGDLVARAASGTSITWGLVFSGLVGAVLAILTPTVKPRKKKR